MRKNETGSELSGNTCRLWSRWDPTEPNRFCLPLLVGTSPCRSNTDLVLFNLHLDLLCSVPEESRSPRVPSGPLKSGQAPQTATTRGWMFIWPFPWRQHKQNPAGSGPGVWWGGRAGGGSRKYLSEEKKNIIFYCFLSETREILFKCLNKTLAKLSIKFYNK